MTAAPVLTGTRAPEKAAPRLSLVQTPAHSVSTLGFVAILVALIAVGLGGVMVVSTSVSAQSRELTTLRRQATELGYKSASLTSELQGVSSANALALRATGLGMVPNPYPAFINLADGSVTGVPTPVKGDEMPFLTGTRPQPLPDQPPAVRTEEPAAGAATDTADDLTAAAATGQGQP